MEKIFTNKSIWKKIVIAILVVMAFQVICSTPIVKAAEDNDDLPAEGDNILFKGILMRPVMSLVVTLGDGIIGLLHDAIMGQKTTLIPVTSDEWWETAWAVVKGMIVALVVAAFAYWLITGPLFFAAGEYIKAVSGTVLTITNGAAWKIVVASVGLGVVSRFGSCKRCYARNFLFTCVYI